VDHTSFFIFLFDWLVQSLPASNSILVDPNTYRPTQVFIFLQAAFCSIVCVVLVSKLLIAVLPRETRTLVCSVSEILTYVHVANMLARAARPKLALALPTATAATSRVLKTPLPPTPVSPSPMSPTARNTRLNQRGFSTLQPPTFAYSQSSDTKGILKKGQTATSSMSKKLHFQEEPTVRCITPVPEDYHGTYVKMSRDERRWGKAS
jgi:hypothetical protein